MASVSAENNFGADRRSKQSALSSHVIPFKETARNR